MRNIKVITDSCSDLTPRLMEQYGIDYAKMMTVLDGVQTPADLSWSADEVHDFYNRMRDGKRITTTQVPVDQFMLVFRKYLERGNDILYIACSSRQSGSVNTGRVVGEQLMKEYEGSTVIAVDSLNASMGEGLLAIEAAKLAQTGISIQELEQRVLALRKRINEFVTVHTLDYLRRCGRVKASAAFFGNLMGVKPIIIADAHGNQSAVRKVKGRAGALNEAVRMLSEAVENPEEQTIYIAHADCDPAEMEQLKQAVEKAIPCRSIEFGYIGPIIGASIGPDAVGLFGIGREVTWSID